MYLMTGKLFGQPVRISGNEHMFLNNVIKITGKCLLPPLKGKISPAIIVRCLINQSIVSDGSYPRGILKKKEV
jgi:hypothetical protein